MTRSSPNLYLFSYGSNHPAQLAERLGHDVREARGAYVEGWQRVFRGWSRRWEGGVASLERKPGAVTYGYIARISPSDLDLLDRYEGVAQETRPSGRVGNYVRRTLEAATADGRAVPAAVYVASSRERSAPSKAYLDAVTKTVGTFWSGVRPESFPLRDEDLKRRRRSVRW